MRKQGDIAAPIPKTPAPLLNPPASSPGLRLGASMKAITRLAYAFRKIYTYVYQLKTEASRMANPIDGGGNQCRDEDLIATGEVLHTPSTRKGNQGGQSVQEGFVDREGRAVTRHTVYDALGRVVHGPHFRPGGFR